MSAVFTTLARELKRRAARAYVSNFTVRSSTLRHELLKSLDGPLGEADTLLASPVFQTMFGWQASATTVADFANPPLDRQLIKSLDEPPPEFVEQRFERTRTPYAHQAKAWQLLLQKEPQSVVVSSGTGSGKTECFLVPILQSLAAELAQQKASPEPLRGVRALLLYPLNALIKSQRQRLCAWTSGFNGKVQFCLYNGNTPKQWPAEKRRAAGPEIADRVTLRRTPPPILVTNATMLEYMLVRQEDQPILQASQGTLRWVVLDEAHTYLGSHAAELSLLIRRVLMAFGVDASQVRFVATSATIGKRGDTEVQTALRKYLARVGGIPEEQVHIVEGEPRVPDLPLRVPSSNELPAGDASPEVLFQQMLDSRPARAVRTRLCTSTAPAAELCDIAREAGAGTVSLETMVGFLDAATRAKQDDGTDPFLRLRGHFFERVPGGVWACSNPDCAGRPARDRDDWRWGKVIHKRLKKCDVCDAHVFEVTFCRGCGEGFLLAAEGGDPSGRRVLSQRTQDSAGDFEDELESELLPNEEDGTATDPDEELTGERPRLLSRGTYAGDTAISSGLDAMKGELVEGGHPITVLFPEQGSERFRCPCCATMERARGQGFSPFRVGQAFALGVALPALLEQAPPDKRRHEEPLPSDGRRLITFTDSRQGTALLALRSQLESQRNVARSFIYHELWQRARAPDAAQVAGTRENIAALRPHVKATPALASVVTGLEADLAAQELGVPPRADIPDLLRTWEQDQATRSERSMLAHDLEQISNHELTVSQVPRFLIAREFLRRPMRANSMETMGLASLRYPAIEKLVEAPFAIRTLSITLDEWKCILKLFLDYFVRSSGGVAVTPEWKRWMGGRTATAWILSPKEDAPTRASRKVRWPTANGRSRMATLIRYALALDPDQVESVFEAAWDALGTLRLLDFSEEGYVFDLLRHGALEAPSTAWLCPVTRRVLDTTLRGWTPYLPAELGQQSPSAFQCQRITFPTLRFPYRRDQVASGNDRGRAVALDEILTWLESDPAVRGLREMGLWSEFSDRIAALTPYARVEEHSAQVPNRDLERIVGLFESGKVNVMSCSTTMEMGVDIGGLSIVGMNNAPPGPSNFLQRAGRAGRRGEATAVSFTLCQDRPHAREVFRRPMWPFTTPIHVPEVTLSSERIVQRHLNAMLLGAYLAEVVDDAARLRTGDFFEPESGVCHDRLFAAWLERQLGIRSSKIVAAVTNLVVYSALEGSPPGQLLSSAGLLLTDIGEGWRARLQAQLASAEGTTGDNSVAAKAAQHHLKRLRGEYLLKYLTTERFLPGHGFPTLVVPFVNTGISDINREVRDSGEDRDTQSSFGDYATRTLSVALREYAPGNGVVMSGKVHESAGLTLHWQRPPDQSSVGESQQLRVAWRCRDCGASGTSDGFTNGCPACSRSNIRNGPFIQPSGMAVDIRARATNDLSTRRYLPKDTPWISTGGVAWTALPREELGRFRYSPNGSIFHRSRGEHAAGYALCLHCGRADSEPSRVLRPDGFAYDATLPRSMVDHHRLRGGRERPDQPPGERCSGNAHVWAIRRNIWLGVEETTDIFELQVASATDGRFVVDQGVAASIAVALRTALAEKIGLEEREIGFVAIPARGRENQRVSSIVLYDAVAGGAGFVAAAPVSLSKLLIRAREILLCPHEQCDAACHACLLSYDTQLVAHELNRHAALKVLSEAFIAALDLPENLRLFGDASEYEFHTLEGALTRELAGRDIRHIQVHLGGDPTTWDFSQEWPLRRSLLRWCAEGVHVVVDLDASVEKNLAAETRTTLKRLMEACTGASEAGGGTFKALVTSASAKRALISVGGAATTTSWMSTSPEAAAPGAGWGAGQLIRGQWKTGIAPLNGVELPPTFHPSDRPPGYVVVEVRSEVDGPVAEFGTRLWKRMTDVEPGLRQRLHGSVPLTRVSLRDRYLRSPLNVRLAWEVLGALRNMPGGIIDTTQLDVETSQSRYAQNGLMFHENWGQPSHAEGVAALAFRKLTSLVAFSARPTTSLPHHREIAFQWADGASCLVRPDQGVTFMQTRLRERFSFGATEPRQTEELLARNFSVEKHDSAAVMVYVSGITQGR